MPRATLKVGVNPVLIKAARSKRGGPVREAVRDVTSQAILHWWKRHLKRHFAHGAQERYRGAYTDRTKRYALKKKGINFNVKYGQAGRSTGGYRAGGRWVAAHQKPLWFSGAMAKTLITSRPVIEMKAVDSRSVRVIGQLPYVPAANFWSGNRLVRSTGQAHNFTREITTVSDDEYEELRRIIEDQIPDELQKEIDRGGFIPQRDNFGRFTA